VRHCAPRPTASRADREPRSSVSGWRTRHRFGISAPAFDASEAPASRAISGQDDGRWRPTAVIKRPRIRLRPSSADCTTPSRHLVQQLLREHAIVRSTRENALRVSSTDRKGRASATRGSG